MKKQKATHATVDILVRVRITVPADEASQYTHRILVAEAQPPLLSDHSPTEDTAILDPSHAIGGPALHAEATMAANILLDAMLAPVHDKA